MQTPGHKLCKWLTGGFVNAHCKLSVGFSVISGKHDNTSTSYSETELFLCSSTGTNIEFYSTVLFPEGLIYLHTYQLLATLVRYCANLHFNLVNLIGNVGTSNL